MTAIALTIAGSDSGGGAGIQADLKAFSALGVFGASAITAITAQNTRTVTAVHEVPAEIVAAQVEAVLDDLNVTAIKVGMLFSPAIIRAVAGVLGGCGIPVVLDPVMIAKTGDALLMDEAVDALVTEFLPIATLLTPNLPEAARLAGGTMVDAPDAMEDQGRALLDMGAGAVLMKGGHGAGNVCTDVLVQADKSIRMELPRLATKNTHGTGCTLSAAIAANLAKGQALAEAVAAAQTYLHDAIKAADTLQIGSGHGPVHHFHGSASWNA